MRSVFRAADKRLFSLVSSSTTRAPLLHSHTAHVRSLTALSRHTSLTSSPRCTCLLPESMSACAMHRSQVRSLFGRKKTDDAKPESEGDAADAKAAAADAVKGDSEGEETSDSSADESEAAESGYEQEDSGSGEEDSAETISDLEVKVQELDGELQKFRDALARSRADLINLEHMAKKDTEHARNFAIKKFSTDVLGVADAIGEACKSFDTMDKELVENKQISNLISGVKLTEKALIDCFHRNGIEKIPSLGEDFDPNVHEALFQQPNPDFDENIVCHVVVEGYTIHGNTLRPAKVGVSAGRPEKPEGSIEE